MKTYEQLYKKALERARTWKEKSGMPEDRQGILDDIFPELKKTRDELIKEELIHFLKTCRDPRFVGSRKQDEWIEWLEKQSKTALDPTNEEKVDNTNKVEPRFKVGDWVVNIVGMVNRIIKDWGDGYTLDNHVYLSDSWAAKNYRLWTAKDARDGNVLVAKIDKEPNDFIYIFHEFSPGGFYSHCYLDARTNNFHKGIYHNTCNVGVPAIKEQRELLFAKMAEEGYVWDGENKELKNGHIYS